MRCNERLAVNSALIPYRGLGIALRFTSKSHKRRADERTRTADLPSLQVMHQALQGCAGGCKCRIPKPVSLLGLAACCTVLHSRWYQSGVNIVLSSILAR
jgi:hypothetical protein